MGDLRVKLDRRPSVLGAWRDDRAWSGGAGCGRHTPDQPFRRRLITDVRQADQDQNDGIYKRGPKYVVRGRGRWESCDTLDQARHLKALAVRERQLDRAHRKGLHSSAPETDCPVCKRELADREQVDPQLHGYALEWVERYLGTGKRGFREETRAEYRKLLKKYARSISRPPRRWVQSGHGR